MNAAVEAEADHEYPPVDHEPDPVTGATVAPATLDLTEPRHHLLLARQAATRNILQQH